MEFGYPLLHVVDQKVAGTPAGTSVSGLNTRTLNTVLVGEIVGASLTAGSDVTLPVGVYYVQGRCPAFVSDRHRAHLLNVTDASLAINGGSSYAPAAASSQTDSIINGRLTVAGAAKTFRIRHQFAGGQPSNGLGVNSSDGSPEVYSELMIWKLK
jgi:hypothetical protein